MPKFFLVVFQYYMFLKCFLLLHFTLSNTMLTISPIMACFFSLSPPFLFLPTVSNIIKKTYSFFSQTYLEFKEGLMTVFQPTTTLLSSNPYWLIANIFFKDRSSLKASQWEPGALNSCLGEEYITLGIPEQWEKLQIGGENDMN